MDDYLLVSFCNNDYTKLARIWVDHIKKLNINNYIIISADNEAFSCLTSQNINTELRPKKDADTFWTYRIKIIQNLLEKSEKKYLVHSDLDAIFKKDICRYILDNNSDVDLYFSQGTVFPMEHLLKHGFVLCCGFFCIKCSDKTMHFMNKYIINLLKIKDDQKAINLELIDTKWNYETVERKKSIIGNKYTYFEQDILGHNSVYDLNISLISFLKIQREMINNDGYVYHVLTPKFCDKKIETFKKLNILSMDCTDS